MSPPAVLSLIYWLVHHTHLFLRYSVSKRTPVMSVHVRIYTWIRRRERLPSVITVKFPVNHSGTLAGWLGSLSASCRAAGLIPAGVEVGPCVLCIGLLQEHLPKCKSCFLCGRNCHANTNSTSESSAQLLYASSPRRHHTDKNCTLTCFLCFSASVSELDIKPAAAPACKYPSVLCFLWFPPLPSTDFL